MKRSGPPAMPAKPGYLLHEDTAPWDWWLKLVITGTLAATLIGGIVLTLDDAPDGLPLLGVTVFDALVFYFVMPRSYQVFDNRLRIVLGGPFGMDIPLSNIKEIRVASGSKIMVNWGIQLATSSRSVMEIVRKKGWSVTISPSDRETFIQRLNEAIKTARGLPKQ
ncbi:MAG: hypothetical protein FJ020_05140 [Chloroflexi bacterium]|nr:hypothetical protein [Chloroflexota bacterium]